MNIGKFCPIPLCTSIGNFRIYLYIVSLVVILSNWVCDNWVYRFPSTGGRFQKESHSLESSLVVIACRPKGSKRCFPNGVFQIPHLGQRQRGKPFQRDKECPKTPVFYGILVPGSAVADPGYPLNAPLWKTPRLENTVCYHPLGTRRVCCRRCCCSQQETSIT